MISAISATIAVRTAKLFFSVLAAVISARALGPAGRGEYYFVVTIAALVIQFGNLGLHASNTYYVARDRSRLPAIAANSLWVALALGGICALVAVSIAQFSGVSSGSQLLQVIFVAILIPAGLYYLLGINLLIGIGRVRLFNVLDVASSVLAVIFISSAAVLLPTVTAFLGAASVAAVLSAVLVYRSVRRLAGSLIGFDIRLFRSGLLFAAKAYACSLLALLVLRANILTLIHFAGPSEVGNYSVALQFMDVLGIIPSATALVLFPNLVRDRGTAWMSTLRNAAVVGAVLTLASMASVVLAPRLVATLFGAEFGDATEMLLILLPGAILIGMATVFSQFLIAIGFPTSLVLAWCAAAIAVVSLGLVAIPVGAGRAAASVLSITYAALFLVVLGLAFAHRNDRPTSTVLP